MKTNGYKLHCCVFDARVSADFFQDVRMTCLCFGDVKTHSPLDLFSSVAEIGVILENFPEP